MDRPYSGPTKIIRAPALKRGREVTPLNERVKLERVLGLTVSSNASLDCDPGTSVVAYPAGCVLVLYNVRKNKQNHIISSSRKTITSLAYSFDGKYLATGECGHQPHVRVWDAHEKVQIGEYSGHKFGINCVAFSPNLKYVVSIGSQHDMIVNVWDWKNNVKVASNKVSCKVKAVSFASGGNYFVTVGNRHVKFWYLEYSRTTKYKLEPVPLMGRSAILGDLRNNYFCDVACGKNNMADSTYAITKSGLLCEFNSRRLLDKWVELRTTSANSLCVGQEFIFIGCADGLVRCFSPFNLNFICTLPRPHYLGVDVAKGLTGSHAGTHPKGAKYPDTIAVTFDETSKKVTCVYNDHSMYTWDIKDIKKVGKSHSFLYHSACIWGVETYPTPPDGLQSVLPPGTFLTCSSDDTIRVWNLEPNMSQNTAYHRNIYSSETLKILYMDNDLSYLCDVDINASGSNDKVDTTYDGKNGVRCLKISPEGRHLAAGDRSGNIRICDLEFMDELCKIEAHDSEVLCLEYSKDSNNKQFLASASRDRLIHIFNVNQDYAFQQTLDDHSSSITAVRFVQQGPKLQMISCGADKSIIFRKAQFTPQLNLIREHHVVGKTTLYDMEVDPQQEHVLTACQDRNIRIYNVQNGKSVRSFRGSQGDDGTLIKVVLDTNGNFVATSCTDKTLYVYDYASGECMACMYGHSELVTGLKFTNNGKHLISVSGDGCIFVWKLPSEFSNLNESKHQQPENILPTIWQDGGRSVGVTKPIQSAEMDKSNKNNNAKSPEGEETNGPAYRFSVGQLPLWAKKQMFEDLSQSKSEKASAPVQPRGRWAQRIEGQNLVVKSYLETDSVIPFPNSQNQKDSSGLKEFQKVRESILQSYQNKSEQNVSDDSSKESGKHGSPNKNVTVRQSQGLDRAKSPPEVKRIRHPTDSSSAGSLKLEDVDAEDECSENENTLYYPPSDEESDHGDGSYKVCATNEDEMRATRKKLRRSRPDRLRDLSSLSTPDSGEMNSEDEDASTPVESEPSFLGSFSVSTENLERLGQREKFMKSNYESLEMGGKGGGMVDGMHFSRASISAKFLAKSGFSGRNESSGSGSESKKSQINIAHSKKREELTKALNEAKKKLETVREQNLGFKGGLSSSKSIGDLHSLPDKDISYIQKESAPSDIRRTSSLSDLSFGGPRRILQPSPAPPDVNVSAPLWKQATPVTTPVRKSSMSGSRHQPAVSVVAPSPSGRNSLPRSISMGSLRGDPNVTPQKVPSVHTLGRVSASPRRSSAITPLTKAASSSTMNYLGRNSESPSHRYSIANIDIQRLHSDDSSSDTSPTEPHKPLPLSKSFTFAQSKSPDPGSLTQQHYPRRPNTLMVGRRDWKNDPSRSKSEKDLRGVGRETNDLRVKTLNRNMPLPDLWGKDVSNGAEYIGPRMDLPENPSDVELTQELCDAVADELKRVTSYAMQIFQRVTLSSDLRPSEKSYMTTSLAQGVLQAQQTLRPAVPPMYPSGASEPFSNASKRPSVSDILPPMGAKGDPNTIALLQQYSDRLFNLIEQRFTKTNNQDSKQSD